MKTLKTTFLAAAATFAMGGAALAQDAAPAFDLSFNLGLTSDYVFRGASQTDEAPQIFGGVDATIGGIGYAGIWASNVDFNDSTDAEYDIYAGVKPTLGPVALDLGVIYYGYANAPGGTDYDYVEFKAAGSVPAGPATVGAALFYSDDFFGGTGPATYVEVNGAAPLMEKLTLSGALGYQDVDYDGDYTTWNLGLGYAINDHLGVDLRYHDTDDNNLGKLYDSRVVVGLKAVF
jgi:uncharacterized protein (TIGR02001 family)